MNGGTEHSFWLVGSACWEGSYRLGGKRFCSDILDESEMVHTDLALKQLALRNSHIEAQGTQVPQSPTYKPGGGLT